MLKLGNYEFRDPVMLAPLAGVSSYPFRMLNRGFGCEFAFLEMIDARSLSYASQKTFRMMGSGPMDQPLGIQLLGDDPKFILGALEKLEGRKYEIMDLNAGCPQRKVTSKGQGAALLKTPKKLRDLLQFIVRRSGLPVTVKMRLGWDEPSCSRDIALYAEDAGVSAIFVHGRTKVQGYSGGVDYNAIKKIKDTVKVPVIASGDIFSGELAKKMFDETGCDGVTVARGALGYPWIFKEITSFINGGTLPQKPGADEISGAMKMHFDMCVDFFGEREGTVKFRKFYIWYTKGFHRVRPLRIRSSHATTKHDMCELINEFCITNAVGSNKGAVLAVPC